jgi:hypothetical protein
LTDQSTTPKTKLKKNNIKKNNGLWVCLSYLPLWASSQKRNDLHLPPALLLTHFPPSQALAVPMNTNTASFFAFLSKRDCHLSIAYGYVTELPQFQLAIPISAQVSEFQNPNSLMPPKRQKF